MGTGTMSTKGCLPPLLALGSGHRVLSFTMSARGMPSGLPFPLFRRSHPPDARQASRVPRMAPSSMGVLSQADVPVGPPRGMGVAIIRVRADTQSPGPLPWTLGVPFMGCVSSAWT